jgi:hypothetical protein
MVEGKYTANAAIVFGVFAACTMLVGCGGPTPVPIIDMAGVDPVAYNRD